MIMTMREWTADIWRMWMRTKKHFTDEQINSLWNSSDERLVGRPEAAVMLNLVEATLANGLKVPNPPKVIKIGKSCKYRVGDLREFVAECARGNG